MSRGNVFVENDTSYANNNCVESWSPGNIFIRNKANHGSYGFWLGGGDQTVPIGNEAAFNGLTNGYPGAYATALYPATRDAGWNFSGRNSVRFWIKARNPNTPGWQNAGPVVRLIGREGWIEFKPFRDANVLNDPPFSEARWTWLPVSIPLAGDAQWQRTMQGRVALERIDAISLALDSWGNDPFTIWLDGLTVE